MRPWIRLPRLRLRSRVSRRDVEPRRPVAAEPLESRVLFSAPPPHVLVFTRTLGWRHDSIQDAVIAVRQLGQRNGFVVDHTEDPHYFTDKNLSRYSAVIFLLTTGNVLDKRSE